MAVINGDILFSSDLSNLGVLPRKKIDELTPLLLKQQSSASSINISDQGDYHITKDRFIGATEGELYDGENKILQWSYDAKGRLIVEAFTNKQINIFGDFELNECLIKANGPLFFEGKIQAKTSLAIEASALLFADKITCDQTITLSSQQGVGLFAPITAKHLTIDAAHVLQGNELTVSGQLDVTTQTFIQQSFNKESHVLTKANSLRLVSSQCEIAGDLNITGTSFLAANTLVLGDTDSPSTINLDGINHIHVSNLVLTADTQLSLGDAKTSDPGTLIIDHHLSIDKSSILDLNNTLVSAESINNKGELNIKESTLDVDEVQQDNIFDAVASEITVFKRFNQGKKSHTELKNNNFFCKELNEFGGTLIIDDCNYKGTVCNVYAGNIDVKEKSTLALSKSFLLGKASTSAFTDSKIAVKEQITIAGMNSFTRTEIVTEDLHSLEAKLHMDESKITARGQVKLLDGADLKKLKLRAKHIDISGDLAVHGMDIHSRTLDLSTTQADIDGLTTSSNSLSIRGGAEEDKVVINNSSLTTKVFACSQHLTLDKTFVYGIDQRKICHDIRAKLKLRESIFVTESQLSQHKDSTIDLGAHSTVHTGLLYSQGAMKARDSTIFSVATILDKATLDSDESSLFAAEGLFTRGSRITLKHHSQVQSIHLQLGEDGSLELGEASTAKVSEALEIAPTSKLSSDSSIIVARKIKAEGQINLRESMLNAGELRIYDEFKVEDTKVSVQQLIAVARGGRIESSDSTIASQTMYTLGDVHLTDSTLAVKEKLSVYLGGELVLEGRTAVLAGNMAVSGSLTTVAKENKSSAKEKPSAAHIKVDKLLLITEDATVSGNSGLVVEAPECLQSGTIELPSFSATGKKFTNFGTVNVDTIYWGFDDIVLNTGSISAKNMTVYSNFFNVLGTVSAKQHFSSAGLFSVNFGLIAANNYTNSSLLSIGGGLVLPNFSADYEYIFSAGNLFRVAQTAATLFAPGYTSTIGLACMAPGLAGTTYNLYQTYKQHGWEQLIKMPRHQLVSILCQIKNAALLGQHAWDAGFAMPTELSSLSSDLSSIADDGLGPVDFDWLQMGISSAGIFAGRYTDSSLVHLNVGGSIAGNSAYTDVCHFNSGLEFSLLSHNTNTDVYFNSGFSGGTETVVLADRVCNSGDMVGIHDLTMKAGHVVNTSSGSIAGKHVVASLDTLENAGKMAGADDLKVQATRIVNTQSGHVTGERTAVKSDSLDNAGTIAGAEQLTVQANQLANTDLGSLLGGHVDLRAAKFENAGAVSGAEKLTVQAIHVENKHSGSLLGDDLEVFADEIACDGALIGKEHLVVQATHVAVDGSGSLTGGHVDIRADDITSAGAVSAREHLSVQADHVAVDSSGSLGGSEVDVRANTFTIDGAVSGAEHLSVQAARLGVTGSLSGRDVDVLADDFTSVGAVSGTEHLSVQAMHVGVDSTGSLSGREVDVLADDFTNAGAVSGSEHLSVQAAHVGVDSTGSLSGREVDVQADDFSSAGAVTGSEHLSVQAAHAAVDSTGSLSGREVEVLADDFTSAGAVSGSEHLSVQANHIENKSSGTIISNHLEVRAGSIGNEGEIVGVEQLTLQADKMDITSTGSVDGTHVDVMINTLAQGGHLSLDHGQAVVDTLTDTTGAVTDLSDLLVGARSIELSGQLATQEVQIQSEQVRLNQQAHVTMTDTTIFADTVFHDDSQMSVGGQVVINTDKYEHGGQINSLPESKETVVDLEPVGDELVVDLEPVGDGVVVDLEPVDDGMVVDLEPVGDGVVVDLGPVGDVVVVDLEPVGDEVVVDLEPVSREPGFYVQANTMDLHGAAEFRKAYFDIKHLPDGVSFVTGSGPYSNYHVSDNLVFVTEDSLRFDSPMNRACNITVSAADITMLADYQLTHDLTLKSTVGDVTFRSNISADNLYARSAHDILTNGSIYTQGAASFEAAGDFYNLAGTINADVVAIKANRIQNISAGSSLAQQAWAIPMGSTGIINGRTSTFLESAGNVENYGGIVRGGDYTQIIAKGDVVNTYNTHTYRGAYDDIQVFDGGLISGGAGQATDGLGLYIQAGGKIVSLASDFVSTGSNYMDAAGGFDFSACQETHVVEHTKKKSGWFGTKEHIRTETTVRGSVVHSDSGSNILRSEHGGLSSVATSFSALGGTEISASGDVLLYSLKSEYRVYDSKSSFFGLSKKSVNEIHQTSTPTLFIDSGITRITSTGGSVDARGAYFVGSGDLSIQAFDRIKFGVDILDHQVVEKSSGLGIELPGMGAWSAWNHGGSLFDMVCAEDATVSKLNGLLFSGNTTEWLANSASLGIDVYNTTNRLMSALSGNTPLIGEVLSRYGLGGAEGFSPHATISWGTSKTTTRYQTLAAGGVDRGNVSLKAGKGIDLENGVRVHAAGDMDVDAPELTESAAALDFSRKTQSTKVSLGVSPLSELTPTDVAVSRSSSTQQGVHYENAELSADGHMSLHDKDGAMSHVKLDGGNIVAGTLDAEIDNLEIIDKQDHKTTHDRSVSAGTSGRVSFYKGDGEETMTYQHSGIHVVSGINTDGYHVHIGKAEMTGGKITTDGVNAVAIDSLVARSLEDNSHYSGAGFSLDVNDFKRIAGQKPTNEVGEQAIATAEISRDRVDYHAIQDPVIYGAGGTSPELKEQTGKIHTSSSDGRVVDKDKASHVHIAVPITNKDYMEASRANITAGVERIQDALGLHKKTDPIERIGIEPAIKTTEILDAPLTDAICKLDDIPVELQREFADQIKEAQKELKETGHISEHTLNKLNHEITTILDLTKRGGEHVWELMSDVVGHGSDQELSILTTGVGLKQLSQMSSKIYVGAHGVLFSLSINLILASMEHNVPNDKVIVNGVSYTAADLAFAVCLRYAAGSLSGPIGWGYIGASTIDAIIYKQSTVNRSVQEVLSTLDMAQHYQEAGDSFLAGFYRYQATAQLGRAGSAEAFHKMVTIPKIIAHDLIDLWKRFNEPSPPSALPPSHGSSVGRDGFFGPGTKRSESKPASPEQTVKYGPG